MYKTEEERLAALRASRYKYQKNKAWYCDVCNNGKRYSISGKSNHEKTQNNKMNLENKKLFVNDLITI